MSIVLQPGTYEGTIKSATIYEAPSGAVMFQAMVDFDGVELRGGICLIQKDGTLSERGLKDVKTLYGLENWDWGKFDVEPEQLAGPVVSCVVEVNETDKGAYSNIKHMNVPGSGQVLAKADVKSLASKYGAKTRALFGGAPSAPAKPAAPKPPAPKPPAPKVAASVSTMEECWEKFCQANSSKGEIELYELWAMEVKKATNKDQNDCTPEDWGKVRAGILPF
jgi:hypothetical protein